MSDIESILLRTETQVNQTKEVERIMALEPITENPLEYLELPIECYVHLNIETKQVKKAFRTKSLLVHPDKNSHKDAGNAFELLKKAESLLMDEAKRSELIELIKDARASLFYKKRIAFGSRDDADLQVVERELNKPTIMYELKRELRKCWSDKKTRAETRYRNELFEQNTRIETLIQNERKRKAEEGRKWEETRQDRADGYRKFTKSLNKKKKTKDFWE